MNISEEIFANLPREVRVYISKLEYDLWHDSLTGVLSRKPFIEICEQELAHTKRFRAKGFALIFIDINDFKKINDTFGHLEGDQALKKVASKIKESIRAEDSVARFGGDEFVILLRDVSQKSEIEPALERLKVLMQGSLAKDNSYGSIGISGGCVFADKDSVSVEYLLKTADQYMYKAKKERGTQNIFFFFGE